MAAYLTHMECQNIRPCAHARLAASCKGLVTNEKKNNLHAIHKQESYDKL